MQCFLRIATIFAVLFCFFLPPSYAATYYMRADGTAANKGAASGPCTSASASMSFATYTGETFSGNDEIKVCAHGGEYDTTLIFPSQGTSGNEIIYTGVPNGLAIPTFDDGVNEESQAGGYIIVQGIRFEPGIAEAGTKTFEGGRFANEARTWQAAEETPITGWDKADLGIFAVSIGSTGGDVGAVTPQLYWRDKTDSGSFAAIGATGEVKYTAVSGLTDNDNVTSGEFGTSSGKSAVTCNQCEQEDSHQASTTTSLLNNQFTELQIGLSFADGDELHEYEFQLRESDTQIGSASLTTVTLAGGPAPIARWRFESGALATDSSGNDNTLTLIGTPDTDMTNYWEGSASIYPGTNEGASIAVSSLSSGYWLTSGYETGSITFWIRPDTDLLNRQFYEDTDSNITLYRNTASDKLCAKLKYSSGSTEEKCFDGDTIAVEDVWHVGITYDDSTGNWIWRVWDETASTQHSNETDTFTSAHGNLDGLSGTLYISCAASGKTMYGNLDHLNIFNEVLTDGQIDKLRNNTYY